MNHLQDIQQQLLSAVYDQSELINAGSLVQASDGLDATSHVGIYRDSIRLGLAHALHEQYPVCARLIGDTCFAHACEQYIQQHRSDSPDLNRYGLAFPEFLDMHALATQLPWLPDLVRLERAWHQVFSGPDMVDFDLQRLAGLTGEQGLHAGILLQENMQLLESCWPVDKIWHANRDPDTQPDTIELTEQGLYLLIWRDQKAMHLDVLPDDLWFILNSLQAGHTLSDACEQLEQRFPEASFADLFALIAGNRWIADISDQTG